MIRSLVCGLLAASLATPVAAQNANLTVIHGVPGLPAPVGVDAGGTPLFPGTFDFGDTEGPFEVLAGNYVVDVVLNGAPAITGNITLTSGGDFTAIAHLDPAGNPTLSLFQNDLTPLATAGTSRVDVRHLAQAGPVDVVLEQNGAVAAVIPNIANGGNAIAPVPAGVYDLSINAAGTSAAVLGPITVEFEEGRGYQVHAVGVALQPSFGLLLQRTELSARVTVVHGIPGLGSPVDVRSSSTTLFSFDFTDVAGPLALLPGTYSLSVAQGNTTLLAASPTVAGGDDVTITANLDAAGSPVLSLFPNDTSAINRAGDARVAIRHVAAAPAVDVVVSFPGTIAAATFPDISNGGEATGEIARGTYEISAFVGNSATPVLGPARIELAPGGLYNIHIIGDASAGSLALATSFVDLSRPTLARGEVTFKGTSCGPTIGVNETQANFGGTFTVTLGNARPSANAFLLMGRSDTQWALGTLPFNFFGLGNNCLLFIDPMVDILVPVDATGQASFSFSAPARLARSLADQPLFFQWVTFPGLTEVIGATRYIEVGVN